MERSGGPLDSSSRFAFRSRSFRGFGRSAATVATTTVAAAVAATVATTTIAATVATTMAASAATTTATRATVATGFATAAATAVAIATTVATTTTVARSVAATVTAVTALAAVATVTGLRRLGAAHQCQTDDREEDRDTKSQNTIHPRCLQKTSTLRKAQHTDAAKLLHPQPRRHPAGESKTSSMVTPDHRSRRGLP